MRQGKKSGSAIRRKTGPSQNGSSSPRSSDLAGRQGAGSLAGNPSPYERILEGSSITGSRSLSLECPPYAISVIVKKGHDECGDSALVYHDRSKIILAVFDGVSGEPGASRASGDAARSILSSLKGVDDVDEGSILSALQKADTDVRFGFTTALVLSVKRESGEFLISGIGDSPAYSRDSKGVVSLELPLSRVVQDNDSIMRFFSYRNIVSSVIGQGRSSKIGERPGGDVLIRSGTLSEGDAIILASDALTDNLYVEVKDGFVTDSSGTRDLQGILGKENDPERIVARLVSEIQKRIEGGRVDKEGAVLIPKKDDLSIAVITRTG